MFWVLQILHSTGIVHNDIKEDNWVFTATPSSHTHLYMASSSPSTISTTNTIPTSTTTASAIPTTRRKRRRNSYSGNTDNDDDDITSCRTSKSTSGISSTSSNHHIKEEIRDESMRICIIDFGLSKLLPLRDSSTNTQQLEEVTELVSIYTHYYGCHCLCVCIYYYTHVFIYTIVYYAYVGAYEVYM